MIPGESLKSPTSQVSLGAGPAALGPALWGYAVEGRTLSIPTQFQGNPLAGS